MQSIYSRQLGIACVCVRSFSTNVPAPPPERWGSVQQGEREGGNSVTGFSREEVAHNRLNNIHTEDIKDVIKKVSMDASMTDRPFTVLLNEVLGYITTQMNERVTKVSRWFGDNGNVNYIKDVSSMPDEEMPVFRRRWLDKTQNVSSRSKSYAERQRESNLFRLYRAKEDSGNYMRSDEERFEDVFRPTTLDGYGGVVESRIRNCAYRADGKPIADLDEPEHPYLDTGSVLLNRILIKNGALPRWLEINNEIKEVREILDEQLLALRYRWKAELSQKKIDKKTTFQNYQQLELARPLLLTKVKQLNKLILDFNLVAPSMHLQKFGVTFEVILQELEDSDPIPAPEAQQHT